jgi:hypothetical protein
MMKIIMLIVLAVLNNSAFSMHIPTSNCYFIELISSEH